MTESKESQGRAAAIAEAPPRPIAADVTELIGETPLIELRRFAEARGLRARLLGKVEFVNPLASVKDRIAWSIIRDAEASGKLVRGKTIVDITSGNTGIALATLAASRGYKTKFYLGDNTSPDKRRLLEALGAELAVVPNGIFIDPEQLAELFERVEAENPDAFITDQLGNPVNQRTHYETTGPEIWRDSAGEVDVLVAGVGTGGTISGAGRYLKERKPSVQLVVSEPGEFSVPAPGNEYPDEIDGIHQVAGIEEDRLPLNYDFALIDEVLPVEAAEAYENTRALLREEGLFVGPSSGAALAAAVRVAERPENEGKTIVLILPDTGERYLSAPVFARD